MPQVKATGHAHARVEIRETVDDLRDLFADAVVVLDQGQPRRPAARQRGRGESGDDRGFRQQRFGRWRIHARRQMHHAHRVLDGHRLRAAGLQVDLGAAQARQDQRVAAVHQVRAVELGADVHGQRAVAQRRVHMRAVRRSRGEISTHGEEHLGATVVHGLDRVDRVEARLARRCESERIAEAVEEIVRHSFVDAHRAVALHVGVTADRARTCTGLADVAAQQQQVVEHLDRGNAAVVLGDAHAPAQDRGVAVDIDLRGLLELRACQSRFAFDVRPVGRVQCRGERFVADGVVADERLVDGVAFDHQLAQGRRHGQVAADARLVIVRAQAHAIAQQVGRRFADRRSVPARARATD